MRNETCVSVISTMCITWTPLPPLTSLTLISSSIYSLFIVKHLATQCASSADSFIHSFAVAVAVATSTSKTVLTLITYVAFSYVYHTYTHTDCLSLAHFPSWHRTLPFFFFSFRTRHSSRSVDFSVSYYSCYKSREEKFAAFAFNLRWVIYVHTLVYTCELVANEREGPAEGNSHITAANENCWHFRK